ncbi:MAG: N-acyl-D-glucosamine 2-epimerase [Spirosoma sp.]|nr:N-acyl-D-glucosamine 2-epimerase [Spirosoma sp.]
MPDFQKLSADYQYALLRQVVPFWLQHGRDELCGGYFDLLSSSGHVIEGDKFVTAQAQQVWAFGWLYNTFDGQPAWLAHALHGGAFLRQYAQTKALDCYTQLDRRGRPLTLATDIVPACLVVMAYAQLYRATGQDEWSMLARQLFDTTLKGWETSRNELDKSIGGFRQLRHLSEVTSLLKAVLDMQALLSEDSWKAAVDMTLHSILYEFLDRRTDTLREYILPEGAFVNTPEGRRLNVGLTFQTVAYLLDLCAELSNRKLEMQVITWCLRMCEQAWDETMGGLNQHIDIKSQPSIFPDAQQKWAWVHVETILTLIKGYFKTRHPDCLKWFNRVHDYTFTHFPDQKNVGWHLAIDQHRQPILRAKAIPEICCFSLIKCLAETAQLLTKCSQLQPAGIGIRIS